MKIFKKKSFLKAYKKLNTKLRKKVDETIVLFVENPFNPRLKNHALSGPMSGFRSISVTGDMRIVFREEDGYVVVVLLNVGSHNQVY